MRTRHSLTLALALGAAGVMLAAPLAAQRATSATGSTSAVTAIVGATVIDGNGGAPGQNATVVVTGSTSFDARHFM